MEDSNENNDKLGTDNLPKDGNSEDVTFCESDAENSDKPATTTITVNNRREPCVEDQDDASIDILGDKENLPPELQDKTFTKNEETTLNKENKMNRSSDIITSKEIAGDVTFCESDVENIEELEHINEVNFNANLSEHRNNTSTPVPPDNADIVHDVLNNSQRQPNTLDTDTGNLTATSSKSGKSGSKSASRSGSTSGSSSSSSSSSDGEDSDDSARDPDYVNVDPDHVNHNATDSASTETMDSFREIPSPQPSTSNNPDGSVKKGRKRIAAPSKWMQNKRKRLRNTGQAYKSNKNKDVPAKCVKPPCGENCRFRCSSKIIEAERRQIFEEYWKLGDINRQRNYINQKMVPITRKYRYTTTQKGREYNHAFYFYLMGQKLRVCKKFFMRTLDINERVIRTVISKITSTGELEDDQRGKHENRTAKCVPEEIKDSVRNHINSIPRIESHYLRQQTTREFIDGGKTIAELHRDYQEERKKHNLPFANYVMYSRIFNTEFNLGFFVPKKDLCGLCDSYDNASAEEKLNLKAKYDAHITEKDQSRTEKEDDKKIVDNKYIVACYDLQAVLPCPKGEVSVFYYKSKLNTFNLTVTELVTKDTECYLWHEGEGNRGSDEIGSCVYKYIEKKMTSLTTDDESTQPTDGDTNPNVDIVFYSDSCCGQNKNQFIIALYIFSVLKFTRLTSITHKFLVPGHTQNENDAAHSLIEKEIKRNLKSGAIYVPSQYAQIIKTAKKQGKPFNVNELTHTDFKSLKKLQADLKFSLKGLKITEVKIIKYTKESPDVLLYKKSYKDVEFSEIRIWRRVPNSPPALQPAYENGIQIGASKKADLINLLEHFHIPSFYAPFYNTLFNL